MRGSPAPSMEKRGRRPVHLFRRIRPLFGLLSGVVRPVTGKQSSKKTPSLSLRLRLAPSRRGLILVRFLFGFCSVICSVFVRVRPVAGQSRSGAALGSLQLKTFAYSGKQASGPHRGGAALKTLLRPEPFPTDARLIRAATRGVMEVLGPLGGPPRIRD